MRKRADYTMPLEEAERVYDEAALRALERLGDLGLGLPPRPILPDDSYYDGHLPADVNSYTNRELGEIYSLQCRFTDWVHSEFIKAKAESQNATQKLRLARAQVRRTKTGTVQAREDDTTCDARVIEAAARFQEADDYSKLIEVRAVAAARDLKVLSRLITVKEQEIEMNRRDLNIGRRKHGRDPFK
jgi:hypothetical protein